MAPHTLRRNSVSFFLGKLVLIYIIIYVGFSVGYGVFGPRQFFYRNSVVAHQITSVFVQPVMEIAATGSINRWYNWNVVNRNDLQSENVRFNSIALAKLGNTDYTQDINFSNFLSVFSSETKAVVLQPKQYSGNWSVIFCTNQICKESNLYVRNTVKMLIDVNIDVMGRTEDGRLIEVNVLQIIPRTERMDLELT